jgi:hypothetical protein
MPDEILQSIVNLQNQINELSAQIGNGNFSNTVLQNKNVIQQSGAMRSPDFVTGSAGWSINADGSVEFNDGTFRGALAASTIDIGGADATSFHVDADGNLWSGAATYNLTTNPFAVSNAGVIRVVSGTIGGTTISSTALTGGIIQTGTSGDYMGLYGSDNTLRLYENSDLISQMKPNATQGTGVTWEFYDGEQTDDELAKLEYDHYVSGSYQENSLTMWIRSTGLASASGISVFADSDSPTIRKMRLSPQLDNSIVCFDGTNDLGNSTNKFDDIWCDELHYTTLTEISDRRLKKNIDPIGFGLAEVVQLNPVKFKWKKNKGEKGDKGYGFIAQEVRSVIPEMVKKVRNKTEEFVRQPDGRKKKVITYNDVPVGEDPTGETMLQIDMSPMIPILVKAIQELNAKVVALESKIV